MQFGQHLLDIGDLLLCGHAAVCGGDVSPDADPRNRRGATVGHGQPVRDRCVHHAAGERDDMRLHLEQSCGGLCHPVFLFGNGGFVQRAASRSRLANVDAFGLPAPPPQQGQHGSEEPDQDQRSCSEPCPVDRLRLCGSLARIACGRFGRNGFRLQLGRGRHEIFGRHGDIGRRRLCRRALVDLGPLVRGALGRRFGQNVARRDLTVGGRQRGIRRGGAGWLRRGALCRRRGDARSGLSCRSLARHWRRFDNHPRRGACLAFEIGRPLRLRGGGRIRFGRQLEGGGRLRMRGNRAKQQQTGEKERSHRFE